MPLARPATGCDAKPPGRGPPYNNRQREIGLDARSSTEKTLHVRHSINITSGCPRPVCSRKGCVIPRLLFIAGIRLLSTHALFNYCCCPTQSKAQE